jgi:hypothetical protein
MHPLTLGATVDNPPKNFDGVLTADNSFVHDIYNIGLSG